MGTIFLKQGDLTRAREQFLAALQIAPKDPQARLNVALMDALEHKFTDAERELEPSCLPSLGQLMHLSQLADLWVEQGQRPRAIARVQQFSRAYPTDAAVHMLLGSLYFDDKNYADAEIELQQAIRLIRAW